ncbi:hypothetical protein RN001_009662 [Aquatica leii]|uniref:Uncharacterized protein n=1 Tax=Aquatica leii TaxID=1421715 RepID=A0AAN7S889_9COLE|nr:hypothetical protein RN001_009662 [Aquatica leii]
MCGGGVKSKIVYSLGILHKLQNLFDGGLSTLRKVILKLGFRRQKCRDNRRMLMATIRMKKNLIFKGDIKI